MTCSGEVAETLLASIKLKESHLLWMTRVMDCSTSEYVFMGISLLICSLKFHLGKEFGGL